MNGNSEDRQGKTPGGDIVMPAGRQHGKVWRFLDNFWYHHKWKTLIGLFFLIVIIVCTVQMCSKESEKSDLLVVCAGPYNVTTDGEIFDNLQKYLSVVLPEDFDGNGEKRVSVIGYTIYSEEQLKAMDKDAGAIASYNNSSNYQNFYQHLGTGEFSVAFVDPFLFEELAARNECLVDISAVFGVSPSNGLYKTLPNGKTVCYGVRLGDSKLYENNALKALPEDTVLCLVGSAYFGDDRTYERAVKYFAALLEQN